MGLVFRIEGEQDIIAARRGGRKLASELGFSISDQTRLATAISELTRNIVQHAGSGTCTIIDESTDTHLSIRVCVQDRGPGIADLEAAMRDGFTTGKGLGVGLPAVRRLVDLFEIASGPGCTKVVIHVSTRRCKHVGADWPATLRAGDRQS